VRPTVAVRKGGARARVAASTRARRASLWRWQHRRLLRPARARREHGHRRHGRLLWPEPDRRRRREWRPPGASPGTGGSERRAAPAAPPASGASRDRGGIRVSAAWSSTTARLPSAAEPAAGEAWRRRPEHRRPGTGGQATGGDGSGGIITWYGPAPTGAPRGRPRRRAVTLARARVALRARARAAPRRSGAWQRGVHRVLRAGAGVTGPNPRELTLVEPARARAAPRPEARPRGASRHT
jgi:hypothetical protein